MNRAPKTGRFSSADLSWLCGQVALVLKAGVPLDDGLRLMAEGVERPRVHAVVVGLSGAVGRRMPLSEALEEAGGFPPYLVAMTRVGEVAGSLDLVMEGLSYFYERDERLRSRLRGAMTYPAVLALMMLGIILLLLVRVLPIFRDILASLGGDLPPFSRALLSFGAFLKDAWVWLLPAVIGFVLLLVLFFRLPGPRRFGDRLLLRLPFLGRLFRKIYATRFAVAMSSMIRSSIDMEQSLEMSEAVVGNSAVEISIAHCRAAIRQGKDLFASLLETGIFPGLFVRMLSLGQKTGDLDSVMGKVARAYEEDVDRTLRRATSLVEPLLVILLSAVVGAILLSVMLPLIGIMSSIG